MEPVFSPDGRYLALDTRRSEGERFHTSLTILPLAGGDTVSFDLAGGSPVVLRWLPDSRRLVAMVVVTGGEDHDVVLFDRGRRTRVNLTGDEPLRVTWYDLSPGGRRIVYDAVQLASSGLYRADLSGLMRRTAAAGGGEQ